MVHGRPLIDRLIKKFPEATFLTAHGFDEAIIGHTRKPPIRIIYSVSKCISILMKDMGEEDAWEYFYFNVEGSCVGELTPVWNFKK